MCGNHYSLNSKIVLKDLFPTQTLFAWEVTLKFFYKNSLEVSQIIFKESTF